MDNYKDANYEVDEVIGHKIMGWTHGCEISDDCWHDADGELCPTSYWSPTSCDKHADMVLERLSELCKYSAKLEYDKSYGAEKKEGWTLTFDGATAAMFEPTKRAAICKGALWVAEAVIPLREMGL